MRSRTDLRPALRAASIFSTTCSRALTTSRPTAATMSLARLAVERQHAVAGLQLGLRRRAVGVDVGAQRALRLVEAEALGDLVGHRLDADAGPAAFAPAVLLQLLDDRPRQRGRDGEADA